MKGQVRGLALELLRQDCVDCLVVADEYEGLEFAIVVFNLRMQLLYSIIVFHYRIQLLHSIIVIN